VAGVNQRLTPLLYRAAGGIVGWGLPVALCGKVDDLSLDYWA
jgi:hypothetical protein